MVTSKSTRRPKAIKRSSTQRDLQPVLINFERSLLERLDSRIRSMGLRRTAFIVNCVAEKLLVLEQGQLAAADKPGKPDKPGK